MSWLRKLLRLEPVSTAAPAPPVSPEVSDGERRLRRHLSSADVAIRAAMAEVDNTFGYRGPDRRHHPR